jgi:hypothetical protein
LAGFTFSFEPNETDIRLLVLHPDRIAVDDANVVRVDRRGGGERG